MGDGHVGRLREWGVRVALVAGALVAALHASPALADEALGISRPEPLGSLEVPYPEGARGDAVVELELVVGADGAVVSSAVTSGEPPFAEAARKGVESFRFTPATKSLGVRGYLASGKARTVHCPTPDCGPGDETAPRIYPARPAPTRLLTRGLSPREEVPGRERLLAHRHARNAFLAKETENIDWEPAVGLVEDDQSALTLPSIGVEAGW